MINSHNQWMLLVIYWMAIIRPMVLWVTVPLVLCLLEADPIVSPTLHSVLIVKRQVIVLLIVGQHKRRVKLLSPLCNRCVRSETST